jgi:hypothetical protein
MPSPRQNEHRRLSSRETSQLPTSRVEGIRTSINHMFSGRSRVGAASPRSPRNHIPDSPKTPQLPLGLGNFSSTRLNLPYLSRSSSVASTIRTPVAAEPAPQPSINSQPSTLRRETRRIPESTTLPTSLPRAHYEQSPNRFVGVGPEEQHLADLASTGRRRRNRNKKKTERKCAPKIKNRRIRSKILSCFISGLVNPPRQP